MNLSSKGQPMKRIVVGIYIDPDFFPPTISAILNFAEVSDEVIVVSRNNSLDDYPYPSNVTLKKIGRNCSVREMEDQGVARKAFEFLKFTWHLLRFSRSKKCQLLVLYDHIALFSFFLSSVSAKKKVWYHNHDMPIKELIKKRTIGGLAASCEEKAMKYIDYFSLPSQERLQFYPHIHPEVPVFIIPNYPSLKVYGNVSVENEKKHLKIIYQGFIGARHALEEVIQCMGSYPQYNRIELILKGHVTADYKKELIELAHTVGVDGQLKWIPVGPYKELPALTASCTVGIGINKNTDIVNRNQGTASNKIYEYAACGLPVIVFDNEQFHKYLDKYPWVLFTDGTADSLKKIITILDQNASKLGKMARESFGQKLNFEKVFLPVLEKITSTIAKEESKL
jgi:glycosyltransferase involved in cell wall biosynthesis